MLASDQRSDSNLIIDSVRSPRTDAYTMLKLIVSDRRSDSKQAIDSLRSPRVGK